MRYRQLGGSGLKVSVVGLGTSGFGQRIDLDRALDVVRAALDAGITLFDTADVYGDSEEILGEALGSARDDVVIATKFGMDMKGELGPDWGARGSRRYIRKAIESSLRRLDTDWIDLYQMHSPDPTTPIEETLAALDELVKEGKVRYIGCWDLGSWRIADAEWTARTRGFERFISNQCHYSLIDRAPESAVVPACGHYGIGVLARSSLERGFLSGKYRRGEPPPEGSAFVERRNFLNDWRFNQLEALEKYGEKRGVSLLDLAVGGLAAQSGVSSVLTGASSAEQVWANVAASAWIPEQGDLKALNKLR